MELNEVAATPDSPRSAGRGAPSYALWAVLVGLILLSIVETRQYDSLAALSAVPPWCWWGAVVC